MINYIQVNKHWEEKKHSFFTIITPIYNRRKTIRRTIESVENQTYNNIEYIIIDDGSLETADDIIEQFMLNTLIPVMYIKKDNGGVHTARNLGYQYARGEFIVCIDSDDELTNDACQVFFETWNSISQEKKKQIWQMKALCSDQNGRVSSKKFPENINDMDADRARQYFSASIGEQLGCRKANILKRNPFPEPEGVKFVRENILWLELEKKYTSMAINKIVRIYHTEGEDHLSKSSKKNTQTCINALWNSSYELNHSDTQIADSFTYLITIFRYSVMKQLLGGNKNYYVKKYSLLKKRDRIVECLMFIPTILGANFYKRLKM